MTGRPAPQPPNRRPRLHPSDPVPRVLTTMDACRRTQLVQHLARLIARARAARASAPTKQEASNESR